MRMPPEPYRKHTGHWIYRGCDIREDLDGWTVTKHGKRIGSALTLEKALALVEATTEAA